MSLDVIKNYYINFNKKNINGILDLCADEVINDPNQGYSQIGKQKLKAFIETAWSHFNEQVVNLELMANDDESKIASEYLVKGTYYNTKDGLFPATNQEYEIMCTTVFALKNNKIARITRYYNAKKWLDMVNPENAK